MLASCPVVPSHPHTAATEAHAAGDRETVVCPWDAREPLSHGDNDSKDAGVCHVPDTVMSALYLAFIFIPFVALFADKESDRKDKH